MHGVAYLLHHVVHLVVLKVRLIDYQCSLRILLFEGKNIFQVLIQQGDFRLI
jgi:hypothetical protein